MTVPKKERITCPLCKDYGLTTLLETIWYDDGKRKVYRCTQPDMKHEICEHMLTATIKDCENFACNDCPDDVENCNCFSCETFCGACNSFINISCQEVYGIMVDNEEGKRSHH